MKISRLYVENFRGFKKREFNFSDHVTVLIGDNGTGKTAILDALAVALGSLFLSFNNIGSRYIQTEEVRIANYVMGEIPTPEPKYPVVIECEGMVNGQEISWKRTLNSAKGRTTRQGAKEISEVSKELQEQVSNGQEMLLPVIAHYGPGRLWLQKKEKSVEPVKPGSRMLGYVDCLDPASNEKMLLRWLYTMELASLQAKKTLGVLEAVKQAVLDCLGPDYEMFYDIINAELLIQDTSGHTLPFRLFSDGVRNMLGMVADIAYRGAVLNPHLGRQAVKEMPGVVLIDEIGLHLHPPERSEGSQRRVVDDLRRTFPKIQFITTTHSPFIIQSLQPGELIDLNHLPGAQYSNKSIEDIAESVMGIPVPQRSRRYQRMYEAAKEYYGVLQDAQGASPERVDELKRKLDELVAPFSDNVAYHAFLEMKRNAAGFGDENHETD